MSNLSLISTIRQLYHNGGNILELLKTGHDHRNNADAIMISYDFQAGTYTKMAAEMADYTDRYTDAIAEVWSRLGTWESAMEVGVGEATVMLPLMNKLDPEKSRKVFGFDISWSRCRFASMNAERAGRAVNFFVADLFEIPMPDSSVDIVYTSHSLEPNGGREVEALRELCRVANKYVVLLEPDYDGANDEGKARMSKHGYVRHIGRHAKELGYKVIVDKPFEVSVNPLNPTGLTVICVAGDEPTATNFVCPVTRSTLIRHRDVYYSPESGLIYPIIDGLPCLLQSSATLGLHFDSFIMG